LSEKPSLINTKGSAIIEFYLTQERGMRCTHFLPLQNQYLLWQYLLWSLLPVSFKKIVNGLPGSMVITEEKIMRTDLVVNGAIKTDKINYC
jgi:hypothetical protein